MDIRILGEGEILENFKILENLKFWRILEILASGPGGGAEIFGPSVSGGILGNFWEYEDFGPWARIRTR